MSARAGEKYNIRDLHCQTNVFLCCFVDLEKAYDRIPREVMYWCFRRRGIPEKLVRLVMKTYKEPKTQELSREFETRVELHQDSALSPLLLAIVIDGLSEHLGAEDLLFVDDLAIMAYRGSGKIWIES